MRKLIAQWIAIGSTLGLAPAVFAQTPPSCEGGVYDHFDFWIGEWDVTAGERVAGVNRITEEENGCLIVERWEGAAGGTGQSYNFYDVGTRSWRQIWVSRAFTIDYSGGLDAEGRMALEGEIAYRDGRTAPFRGVWQLRDDGTVEQSFTQYDAESEAWQPWFTGLYTRREPSPSPD